MSKNLLDKYVIIAIKIILFFFFPSFIFSNDFYLEDSVLFNLNDYTKHKIRSKKYNRNLIAFYFNQKEKILELENYFKDHQPEFYWFLKEIQENSQKKTLNPSLRLWFLFSKKIALTNSSSDYHEYKKNCDFFGDIYCQWILTISEIYERYYLKNSVLEEDDYDYILNKIYIFIKQKYFVPFMYESAHWLPEYLRRIGLAKESLLILESMIKNGNNENLIPLWREYLTSLILSGEISQALNFIFEKELYKYDFHKQFQDFFKLLYFIEITAENKKKILKLYEYVKRFKIKDHNQFDLTYSLLEIRLLELEYIQKKNYKEVLKNLEDLYNKKNFSEFEKLFLRLIQSRVIFNKDPKMAQRIAEDVIFKSQEKSFYLLEYYATLWNGWILYTFNLHYQANIEFTKCFAIRRRLSQNIFPYSEILGLFLTKLAFKIFDFQSLSFLQNETRSFIPDQKYLKYSYWIAFDSYVDKWKEMLIDTYYGQKNWFVILQIFLESYMEDNLYKRYQPLGIAGIYNTSFYAKLINEKIQLPQKKNLNSIRNFFNNIPTDQYYIFLIDIVENHYFFIISRTERRLFKIPKNSEKNEFKSFVNTLLKKNLKIHFLLNPNSEFFHSRIIQSFDLQGREDIRFHFLSFKKKEFEIKNEFIDNKCIEKKDFHTFRIKETIHYLPKMPALSQIQCDQHSFYELWELERILNNQISIEYFASESFDFDFYQYMYRIAIQNNWNLKEYNKENMQDILIDNLLF